MKICLVGVTHPCRNPRLVREADSLVEAGHNVRVVAPLRLNNLVDDDRRLLATRRWRFDPLDVRPIGLAGRLRSFVIGGRRRAAGIAYPWLPGCYWKELAYTPALLELKHHAAIEAADWFIGHAQAALPVAAFAARRWRAKLGFDCEDLLSESTTDPVNIVKSIEERYLPECEYISVASGAMGRAISKLHRGAMPIVLYNVFPLRLADGMQPPLERPPHTEIKLHWFSQTIGPGRGIEDGVRALRWLDDRVELHLRGNVSEEYRAHVSAIAAESSANCRLFFHRQVDHDDLIRSMADFDIGLALERPEDGNYSITVTNKVFSYLLAGLSIAATNTPGQAEILNQITSTAVSYAAGDPKALARCLEPWLRDPAALRRAQQAAWDAARQRFCWEQEKMRFFAALSGRASKIMNSRSEFACARS